MVDKFHLSQSISDVAAAKNVKARPALFELLLVLHTSSSLPPFLLSVLPTGLAGSLNTSKVQKLRQPRSDWSATIHGSATLNSRKERRRSQGQRSQSQAEQHSTDVEYEQHW